MHRFTRRLTAFAFAAAAAAPLAAQSGSSTGGPPAEPTPGAMAAAEELLGVMDIEQVMRTSAMSMLNAQIEAQPMLAPFRDVMEEWVAKYMSVETMGPRLARIYAETFTEGELRELIAFYGTPLGKKLAERTPELTRRGGEVGREVAEEHTEELQAMIAARAAELEKSRTP